MKISIITVCYNSAHVIETALQSVFSQSYPDIEYIIIDGGSTDGTIDIIHNSKEKIHSFITEPDAGIYDAMNKGLALATGDVISILNSDDFYFHDSVVSRVMQIFKDSPTTDLVLGNVDFVNVCDLTKPVRFYSSFGFSPWKMRFGFMPSHPSAFIKKSTYDAVGLYKIDYKIGADFDMFVRMLMIKKMSYIKLNQTLVRMRTGGVSTSGFKSNWIATGEILRSLKENTIYSNSLFVLIRLPVKFLQIVCLKFGLK